MSNIGTGLFYLGIGSAVVTSCATFIHQLIKTPPTKHNDIQDEIIGVLRRIGYRGTTKLMKIAQNAYEEVQQHNSLEEKQRCLNQHVLHTSYYSPNDMLWVISRYFCLNGHGYALSAKRIEEMRYAFEWTIRCLCCLRRKHGPHHVSPLIELYRTVSKQCRCVKTILLEVFHDLPQEFGFDWRWNCHPHDFLGGYSDVEAFRVARMLEHFTEDELNGLFFVSENKENGTCHLASILHHTIHAIDFNHRQRYEEKMTKLQHLFTILCSERFVYNDGSGVDLCSVDEYGKIPLQRVSGSKKEWKRDAKRTMLNAMKRVVVYSTNLVVILQERPYLASVLSKEIGEYVIDTRRVLRYKREIRMYS